MQQRLLFFNAIKVPLELMGKAMLEGAKTETIEAALNGPELFQCLATVGNIGFDKILTDEQLDVHDRFMMICSNFHQTIVVLFAKNADDEAESPETHWDGVVETYLPFAVRIARSLDDFMNFDEHDLYVCSADTVRGNSRCVCSTARGRKSLNWYNSQSGRGSKP